MTLEVEGGAVVVGVAWNSVAAPGAGFAWVSRRDYQAGYTDSSSGQMAAAVAGL